MRTRYWLAGISMILGGLLGVSPVQAGETPVFSEVFAEELAEGWHWLRERPEDWRLVDGALELRSRPGLAETVTTVLWRYSPSLDDGPLAFEVTVTFLQELTQQYEQAGLTWYQGGEPVFKLVHELVDGEMLIIPGGAPTESATVTLRLVVSQGQYTAQFRERETDEFRTVAEGEITTGEDSRISLVTYHGPDDTEHWVRFTDFRVLRLAE